MRFVFAGRWGVFVCITPSTHKRHLSLKKLRYIKNNKRKVSLVRKF